MKSYLTSTTSLIGQSSRRGWLCIALVTVAILISTVLPSAAVALLPGGATALAGTPGPGGSVVSDNLLPFEIRDGSGQLLLSGNVQDRVIKLNTTGDFCFEPRLRDLAATALGVGYYILELKVTGYGDTTIDVEWSSTGSGDFGPNNASRDLTGDEVTFLYPSATLFPPSSSKFCFVATDAPAYRFAGRMTITARNGGGLTYSTAIEGTAAPTRLQVYSGGVIQPAIDAAVPGETVVVHAGTYNEAITLRSGINVKGDSAGLVTLRPPTNPGVLINNCVGTEFSGFTVTPAAGSTATTGIEVSGGSPLVKNNIVTGFSSRGISVVSGATAVVSGNRVQNNGSSSNGFLDYGIINLNSASLIANNLISGNEVGCYIGWHESDGAQFVNNTVVSNRNDGLWCYRSNPMVKNNIVTANTTGISASFDNATPVLTYNDVWNNQGFGNYSAQQTGVINIGAGSVSVDPLFAAASPGDYQLAPASPCRDAGDPAAIYNDLDGSRNDMGWTGGPSASPEVSAAPFGG
ncbi:MAG TPA: right-handed parallel beta-helix repeat-containing protein, partial [Verrucomicrobiae bacterium]